MPPYEPKNTNDWLVEQMLKIIRRNRPNPDTPFGPNKPRNARHGRPRGR